MIPPAGPHRRKHGGIPLATVLGIEIALTPSWFLIFLFVTWVLSRHYAMVNAAGPTAARLAAALLTAAMFFASILAHELGHGLVANTLGSRVKRITLFVLGGVAHLEREPTRARDELRIAAAGPLVNLALSALFYALARLGGTWQLPALGALGAWLTWANLTLAVAVLLDATLVRMVLAPAAMQLASRWNWWLPAPLAKILPRLELEALD